MATLTVERPDIFPTGTVVYAYPRPQGRLTQPQPEGSFAPTGDSAAPNGYSATGTISSGKVELTGLNAGAVYMVYGRPTLWNQQTEKSEAQDKYLLMTVPAAAASPLSLGLAEQPVSNKLLGWAFDPLMLSTKFQLTPAGTLFVTKIFVPEPCKITNLCLWLYKKGGTLTASQCRLGLFNEARKEIGATAAAATITALEGTDEAMTKVALETATSVNNGIFYVGIYYNGTTAPELGTAADTAKLAGLNANVTANESRFATGKTGLTTTLEGETGTLTAGTHSIWAAVS